MYVLGNSGNDINEYTLSTPWDIGTATYVQVFSVATQEATPYGLFFKPDGTKFYICGTTADSVYEYNVGTAWNISTASYVQAFSVTAKETDPNAVAFSSDGTRMFVTGTVSDAVHQYNLSTAWNISTAVFSASFSVSAYVSSPQGLDFDSSGTKMYLIGSTFNRIVEYNLGTAWSVSTASFSGVVNTILLGNYIVNGSSGLHVETAQGKAYLTDYNNDRVFQLDTNTAATRFTGSRLLVDPDLHLQSDLVVYNNVHSNNNIFARNGLYSYNYGYVAGTLDVRGAIDLADDDILRLGSSDDWEMYHNATASTNYIDLNVGNLVIRDDGTAGDPTRFTFERTTGNFTATGTVSATLFTSLSDKTQKTDIKPIENALDLVNQLEGVRYKWIDDRDQPSIGVIAQDVEKILPEVVVENSNGLKSVSYGNIVGVLVEAIKEQQEQINSLKKEIELLKK